ncbi:MAG TPA: F0F1 ATP synthase subunit delta [Gammaproteobacteria bacterium]|nr:F0F1 ATP synthase subunit delta [Gammaproteobacteria bacterium]
MTERTTLARPYAEAVFRLASEHKALKQWSEMLQLAVAVMQDPQVAVLVENPRVPRTRFVEFFLDICGKRLDRDGANLIRLLSENHRLALLPEIVALYEAMRASAESRIEAEVISAYAIDEPQLVAIAGALKRRLGCDIDLVTRIDPALLGGIVIRAGDLVIDGSVQGKLHALATHLNR